MTTTADIQALAARGLTDVNSITVRATIDYLQGQGFAAIARSYGYRTPGIARAAVMRYLSWAAAQSGITPAPVRRTTAPVAARSFGVEIECVGLTTWQAAQVLEPVIGYMPNTAGYHGDMDTTRWRCEQDGSLSSRRGGTCEVISPILTGRDGLDEVKRVMAALRAAGARVNRSCGMHVHIDARDLTLGEVADVTTVYADNQRIIDRFVQADRRSQAYHRYCGDANGAKSQVEQANLKGDATKDWKGDFTTTRNSDRVRQFMAVRGWHRYSNVNLCSYASYGSIEFRQHGGSLNGTKAMAWVEMLLALVNLALDGGAAETPAPDHDAFIARLRGAGLSGAAARTLRSRATGYGFATDPA